MNKVISHGFEGMLRDISQSKFNNKYYYEGRNIRIVSTDTQSTHSLTNEKGNSLILTIPIPTIDYNTKIITYGSKTLEYTNNEIDYSNQSQEQKIIGHSENRDYFILFTTDNNGFDCIWKVSYEDYDITLLYLRNLNFSINNPIQAINNFENENIDKTYWVDSVNQLRFININHSIENNYLEELIDISQDVINMSGSYELTQPIITSTNSGGNHTAGTIQYAYNLYRVNSSQTRLSPLSEMISLDRGNLGGGAVNEVVGVIPVVKIDNLDNSYTNIRVYSIKYNSYNQTPIISLIEDKEIPSSRSISVFDDNTPIQAVSLEDFTFLGSDIIIPKHINSKDNRLFLANYEEKNFEIDLDVRAYSFNASQQSIVHTNIYYDDVSNTVISDISDRRNITNTFQCDEKFDAINLNYDVYKYQYNGTTIGGEGLYLKYQLTQSLDFNEDNRYFKDDEIYRIGIQFYNNFGQISLPKWIADFKTQAGNLNGLYNTLLVTLKSEFYIWLNDSSNFTDEFSKPTGYKILVAERTLNDRTIVSSGLLGTMMFNIKSTLDDQDTAFIKDYSKSEPKLPNILLRNCNNLTDFGSTAPLYKCQHHFPMSRDNGPNTECWKTFSLPFGGTNASGRFYQFNSMLQLYSPETLFNFSDSLSLGLKLKIKGLLKNKYNSNWGKEINLTDNVVTDEVKTINSLSSHFGNFQTITGNPYNVTDNGFIAHPGGSDPNRMERNLFYRGYGNVLTDSIQSNVNVISFSQDLSPLTGTDTNNNINKTSLKSFQTTLDADFDESNIEYTITPDLLYIAQPYDIKICSDPSGNNVLAFLNAVTGVQTITTTDLFTSTPSELTRDFNYYLVINSASVFEGIIDLTVGVDGTSLIEEEILAEEFSISPEIIDSTDYFTPVTTNNIVDIYGTPELTEKGQSFTTYNNDVNYRYTNSLESGLTDGDSSYDDDGNCGRRIVTINAEGQRCITFVIGENDPDVENWDRTNLETIFNNLLINGDNFGMIGELVKSNQEIYLGGIYGGNSWEDKFRTNYVEIGSYKSITESVNFINSPGDTFVNYFKFLRINRKNGEINDQCIKEYEEIVEYYTESTIDLKNRNDLSLNNWDDKFLYKDEDYHKYNRVYSQNPNLFYRRNLNYNFNKVNKFDTNVITTKLKSSGEIIDSWTDILPNEVITLDGKFGPINCLTAFNDELYTHQDRSFAFLSINPRIQIQASDGLAVELGNGSVLQDYKYISTKSGSINKWSIIASSKGIYFYDLLNKSYNIFKGNLEGLSDAKSMHTYFINNSSLNNLKTDNPLIKQGISSGYDFINNEVFMTFHQGEGSFTISYNEFKDVFVSFYDYLPSMYISRGDNFITTNPDVNSIYKQYAGEYNNFYGVTYPSYVIFNVNPEPHLDCVFDNINFKSEVYLNDIDEEDKTLTHIQAYNDYQDSTLIPLVVGRNNNLRRKFRDWNALIPRQGRNRIRSPWIKLKLQFTNDDNYKLILHDTNIYYTTS